MKPPLNLEDPPWGDIDGERRSVDGTPVSAIEEDDVAEWIATKACHHYDREVCVVRLNDGRIAAWASWWDVTGSGFHADAYGGDAVLLFGATVEAVLPHLSEEEREGLTWHTVPVPP